MLIRLVSKKLVQLQRQLNVNLSSTKFNLKERVTFLNRLRSANVLKFLIPLLLNEIFTLNMGRIRKRDVKASASDLAGPSKTKKAKISKKSSSASASAPESDNRLQRDFFTQESIPLARALLGKVIGRQLENGQILRGTITETEAYPGSVEAEKIGCHCFITKQTEKNSGIFSIPGTTWVYMTYGVFNMMNISAQGEGSAVLIRAIEPKEDYEIMHQLRHQKKPKTKTNGKSPPPPPTTTTKTKRLKPYELGNGPGKLCKVLNIEKSTCDLQDLDTSSILWIEPNDDPKYHEGNFTIIEATRIGIDRAPESSRKNLYRFYIEDNFSVSTAKPTLIKAKLGQ